MTTPTPNDIHNTGDDFLCLPASESMASCVSEYHSARSSPVPDDICICCPDDTVDQRAQECGSGSATENANAPDIQPTNDSPSNAKPSASSPATPPRTSPSDPQVKSPEFASNRPRDEPYPTAAPERTPNVYINGLPPNFPEDQLLALASPYGAVVSVRTFTRHMAGGMETGYGFVLYETVDSAEKCIQALKRYVDLHPSFSKVHTVPRLMHSPNSPSLSSAPSTSSPGPPEQKDSGQQIPGLSFKDRMARLHDETSTNLYIEGLPLSIDREILANLVHPHAIRSSRFLKSRVKDSQTMIAFMRLETRPAAEEIIKRLHGTTIRGWDNTESVISVRFADTLDQRELRRARDGDPQRLSIAHAALLNYRGKELQSNSGVLQFPTSPPPYTSVPNSYSHSLPRQLPPHMGNPFVLDFSQTPGSHSARPPQDPLYAPYTRPPPPLPPLVAMHPNFVALLGSLAGHPAQQWTPGFSVPPPAPAGLPNHFEPSVRHGSATRAPREYTSAELFLIQAQSELHNLARKPHSVLRTEQVSRPAPAANPVNPSLNTTQRSATSQPQQPQELAPLASQLHSPPPLVTPHQPPPPSNLARASSLNRNPSQTYMKSSRPLGAPPSSSSVPPKHKRGVSLNDRQTLTQPQINSTSYPGTQSKHTSAHARSFTVPHPAPVKRHYSRNSIDEINKNMQIPSPNPGAPRTAHDTDSPATPTVRQVYVCPKLRARA
ncbi:hypothetical protein B0H10DRAFT_2436594 [Mycena sp. CBHHK59/15]|nr:hypothetical protein B0H10DRAFT_2436594 [Mycena sp. CBHHK59/15]